MLKVHLIMPGAIECLCCSEITEMMNKRSTEEVGCITLHPGFQSVCLNTWVLQTAYYSYRQQYGENAIEGAIQANTLKPRVKSNTPYFFC